MLFKFKKQNKDEQEKNEINLDRKDKDFRPASDEYNDSYQKKRQEQRQKKRSKNAKNAIVITVSALLAIVILMFVTMQFFQVEFLRGPQRIISNFVTRVSDVFSSTVRGIGNLFWRLKYFDTLEEEYNKLLTEYNTLKDQNQRMEAIELQLEQYKDLNDEIMRNKLFDGIVADVIGVSMSNYSMTFVIDKGSRHGITDNMAVAVPGALIGYTYDVDENKSSVRCIIDSDSSVAALVENTRDQGTLTGTLSINGKYECRMYYLSYSILPRPGDRVVTSGVGFEFPKGIPIGYVRETTRGLEDSKQYIVVEPIADFEHTESVIVYRYIPAYAEPAAERGSMLSSSYMPLPTMPPQATFFGQKSLATPTESIATETPKPTNTLRPTFTPVPADLKPNYSYNEQPNANETSGTPGASYATKTPSPTPKPTFSIDDMMVEDDE